MHNEVEVLWRVCQASRASMNGSDDRAARLDVEELEGIAVCTTINRVRSIAVSAIRAAVVASNPAARQAARAALEGLGCQPAPPRTAA